MAWSNRARNHTHTPEHRALRKWALANLEYVCAVPGCYADQGLHLDHKKNWKGGGTHARTNIQWLCPPHHKPKIQREAQAGRERWKRKPKRHPGLL